MDDAASSSAVQAGGLNPDIVTSVLANVALREVGPVWTGPKNFWFIWTKTGHVPKRCHNTLEGAETEARRLAVKCPGKKFIILRAVQGVVAEAAQ
jgi:hypothetical protein